MKRYGGVTALANGSLEARGGEVLALMGANGSGKSTLSKVITGVVNPDAGSLTLDGRALRLRSPAEARRHGVAAVYQELSLVPDMSVAENIWLGHEPLGAGLVRARERRARTASLLELFADVASSRLEPDALVADLAPDERQIVEILKALSLDPRVIILDESTASLDSRQVARLFELVERWKAEGKAIVFVSHRMDEVFRLCDRAVVLRSGTTVGEAPLAELNEGALVQMMIGAERPVARRVAVAASAGAPVRLAANNLRGRRLRGVSLELHAGELLGLGGLQGQGQAELLMALFGAVPYEGEVRLNGAPIRLSSPRRAIAAGIALVPGDRGREGLLGTRSILENMQLPSWRRYGLPLRLGQARNDATALGQELRLVMPGLDAPVSSLSGGNAQKVVLGKWLLRKPGVLLLNDPTKGVDVGAKGELYTLLDGLRRNGTAILLYSSDDEELIGLCDRALVLHDGLIRAELAGASLNRAALVAASMGS